METDLDEKIKALKGTEYKNWQRITFNLRKHLDMWSHTNVKSAWAEMKLSYWPVICNMGIEGSTVAELSRKSLITKQNISRTIKELEAHGIIVSKLNEYDRRSDLLLLTEKGKKIILEANTDALKINERYLEIVAEADLEITIRTLNKILAFHEQQADKRRKF